MEWQPLSVREGLREADGPYEGVPPHMSPRLVRWLTGHMSDVGRSSEAPTNGAVASLFRLPLTPDASQTTIQNKILSICKKDESVFIDVVDAFLNRTRSFYTSRDRLQQIFDDCGSVFTIRPDGMGLQRRVSDEAAQAVGRAIAVPDVASAELKQAWSHAFDLHPNPSYAWNHAVKAVEAVLIPLVVPNQDKPHLGHVLGALDRQGDQFELALTPQQGISSIETFVAMLRLMYPNPHRHTGPDHRVPTLAEAQAVVHLAVTIVQWARDGVIGRRAVEQHEAEPTEEVELIFAGADLVPRRTPSGAGRRQTTTTAQGPFAQVTTSVAN